MYAFRCKQCGFLHTPDDAAEALHPHACRVCGGGVAFDPRTGNKTVSRDNWEVLADAAPERLEELGLAADDVKPHEPWGREQSVTRDIERAKAELANIDRKRQSWEQAKADLAEQYRRLEERRANAEKLVESLRGGNDHASLQSATHVLDRINQDVQNLENQVPVARDDEHEQALKAGVTLRKAQLAGTAAQVSPKHVLASAAEGKRSADHGKGQK